MADDLKQPEVPAADRDAQREFAKRAGEHDPAIEMEKKKEQSREEAKKSR